MDSAITQIARELADAVGAAVSADGKVEACREKARAAGYEVRLSLEAVVGFVSRATEAPVAPPRSRRALPARTPLDITANDRRFLKSLRISADETTGKEAE